jgi:hypothetical protein
VRAFAGTKLAVTAPILLRLSATFHTKQHVAEERIPEENGGIDLTWKRDLKTSGNFRLTRGSRPVSPGIDG